MYALRKALGLTTLFNEAGPPGEGGEGGGGGTPGAPASFDAMLDGIFPSVEKAAVEAGPAVQGLPPGADAEDIALRQAQQQTQAQQLPNTPAQVPNHQTQVPQTQAQQQQAAPRQQLDPVVAQMFQAQQQLMTQMAQQQAWLIQQQQLAGQQAQAQSQRAPEPPPAMPSALDLAKTYRPPAQQQGETNEAYAARAQAGMLDHINTGIVTHMETRQKAAIQEAIQGYQRQVEAAQAQQASTMAWNTALDQSIRDAGFDPATPNGRLVRDSVDAQLRQRAQQLGERAQHIGDDLWKQAMGALATRYKGMAPAVTAPAVQPQATQQLGQPNLQVINGGQGGPRAPISGGGTTTVQQPGNAAPPVPKNFTESIDQLWAGVAKSVGQ